MEPLEFAPAAISLLDVDADLGTGIDAEHFDEARRRAAARVLELEGARWDPSQIARGVGEDWFGLFVIDGLLMRRVTVAGRTACEILGAGDLFRPWDEDGDYEPLVIEVDWMVLKPTRLAMLDRSFAVRVARWPGIAAKLLQRAAGRARNLALIQAVTHLPRTHARLLLLFWLLAERWGKVGPEGVLIQLPLTHQVLAMLVGSHRPTVTIALQKLAREGLLIRQSSSRWLLTNLAVERLHEPGSLSLIGGAEEEDDRVLDELAAEG
jgi:CRP/FNR family transcriptional regulator, cyclic AMP receptor protein